MHRCIVYLALESYTRVHRPRKAFHTTCGVCLVSISSMYGYHAILHHHFSTPGLISISHVNDDFGWECKCQYASAIYPATHSQQLIQMSHPALKGCDKIATHSLRTNLSIRPQIPILRPRDINHAVNNSMGNMHALGPKFSC